ncbi:CAP domain-containing protein [Aestuariivirga sp.]|uniref:CAP domain-containing protein n=1 Tax=Aestuariivirga sp. TaxID=2650926 RepID=UPI00391D7F5F
MAELTAREQYMLELVNRARMDPAGEAARFGISLNQNLTAGTISATPKQVLAPNQYLADAADSHSSWMLSTDTFSHTGINGSNPGTRMTNAGYQFTGSWTWGENIAWSGTTGTLNADAAIAQHHKNLFLSAGHRLNLLNDNFREAGIGSITGTFTSGGTNYNALMTTQNFAKSGSNSFVTGVIYNDTSNDDFYSIGEGVGGRTVTLLQNGSTVSAVANQQAGGYSLGTSLTGTVEVRFTGTGLASAMGVAVALSGRNVKIDLVDGNTILANVSATLTQSSVNLSLIGIENINGTGNGLGNTITGNAGNNALFGAAGNDTLRGGAGLDVFDGGEGDDVIHAESGDNLAGSTGGAGYDKLYLTGNLPAGFDFAANGFEELWVNGSLVASAASAPPAAGSEEPPPPVITEDQTLTGTAGADTLTGGTGNDTLSGLGGNDTLRGGAGNDQINGGTGADAMFGGNGSDAYFVDNTGDVVDETGTDGVDTVFSSVSFSLADSARAKGSVENLTLTGTGSVNATGNSLNNVIMGNAGANKLSGGSGIDTVSYEKAGSGVTVTLASTSAQSTGGGGSDTLSGFENLTGSIHADRLTGSSGNNVLHGLGGNDTLSGGYGNDVLIGGAGADRLIGGSGGDRFVFTSLADSGDLLTDFVSGTDKLDLTQLLEEAGLGDAAYQALADGGNLVFEQGNYATGTSSNSSSILDTRIYLDVDGAGSGARVLIATLEDSKVTGNDVIA